jgi:hypothetical protein
MRPPHAHPQRRLRSKPVRLASAAILACVLMAVAGWSLAANTNHAPGAPKAFWLVLASDRDGASSPDTIGAQPRGYSLRPDGSRLTRLPGGRQVLIPVSVSADGRTVAYLKGPDYAATKIYVSRADGTGLRRVVRTKETSIDIAVLSPDGEALAFAMSPGETSQVFVVGTDGQGRRHLGSARPISDGGPGPAWSPDGKTLAYATAKGCVVVTEPLHHGRSTLLRGKCGSPEWSPNGKALAFETAGGCAVVPQSAWKGGLGILADWLEGTHRVLVRGQCEYPEWSPNGRWIAYGASGCPYCESVKRQTAARKLAGVWIVRPNGDDRRRLAPPPSLVDEDYGQEYAWSPDGERLAVVNASNVFVATLDGRRRRLRLGLFPSSKPAWSPDGSRLFLDAHPGRATYLGNSDPDQIWSVRLDGHGLRRLTSAGNNGLAGIARLSPAQPPAAAVPPSERVLGPTTLETRRPIGLISADGGRVAYTAATTGTDCEHVSIWAPAKRSILRVWRRLPAPCEDDEAAGYTVYELALAASFVGWSDIVGCGNSGCGVEFTTAALPEADPIPSGEDDGADYGEGNYRYFGPLGHGDIFVSDSGVRVALPGGKARRCNLPRAAYAESVDGRMIAVEETAGIAVFDNRCRSVKRLRFGRGEVKAALLDGGRLVVERSGQLEVYDVRSGALELQRSLPTGYVLRDVSGGIALLRHGRAILLLRLADGRSFTLEPGRGRVSADIEAPGLYFAYTTAAGRGRLEFFPRTELERRLSEGAA